jgi:hypothetical protein
MTETDLEVVPRKPLTQPVKPTTDRPTREPAEHPDRIPEDRATHPVTSRRQTAGETKGRPG